MVKAKPTVGNTSMVSANTEYSYSLPTGTREFWIKLRDIGYKLQVCMVSGESDTTYFTVQSGALHKERDIKVSNLVLYFRSSQASQVAETLSFV